MLETAQSTDLWVRRFHRAPQADARLVCLPHAGGSARYFFRVSRSLSPRVDVLAVQYPGRQDRRAEPCIEDIGLLADQITASLQPWIDRPMALFGHSMGAILGFEVALRLEAAGAPVTALFASGRRAPSTHRDEAVHLRDDSGIIAEVRSLSGTHARIIENDKIIRTALPSIRSDYKATETYRHRPGTRVACPIHALVGDNDPKATVDEARRWNDHTTGGFELSVFPGGHFYLDQQAPTVLEKISRTLR
jgi:pyochelin biosynthesis protein PchC